MYDLLGPIVEGFLSWIFSDRARWLWVVLGLCIVGVAWLVGDRSLVAALAIGGVGALAIICGVVATIFGGPEERD